MKVNWTRRILGGLSLTSALFIFQACYGTNKDYGLDLRVQGLVKSKTTGSPVKGIKVMAGDSIQYVITDENGTFDFYIAKADSLILSFKDTDTTQNGNYVAKDTVLKDLGESVYVTINLEDK
jgi:hypothetical protein